MNRINRSADVFVIAAWSGVITGLAEGALILFSRRYLAINAAHKSSADALWTTPLVVITVFLVIAALLWPILKLVGRWLGMRETPILCGFFAILGSYTVLTDAKVLKFYAWASLSLGVGAVVYRVTARKKARVVATLRRRIYLVPALVAAAFLGVLAWERGREALRSRGLPAPSAEAPNILIIVLDTVRADRFDRPAGESLTPNLDRLAARGVVFSDAWSTTSWSLPSQASILTGLYPHEHESDWPGVRMRKDIPTLAEYLGSFGYAAGAISGNASWITEEYMGRGFLRFEAYCFENLVRRTTWGREVFMRLDSHGFHGSGRGKKAPRVNAQFLDFLDDYPDRPFFGYLCYMDVNQAFHDRRNNHRDSESKVIEAYDRALTVLDGQVGELLDELERRGALANTLLFVTSDHGESFGEKDNADHDPTGHGTSLYREQSAVPLFVVYPARVPAGQRVTQTVTIRAIPATVAVILGLENPFLGDPLPMADPGATAAASPARVLSTLRYHKAPNLSEHVLWAGWQLINTPVTDRMLIQGEELFNLNVDPASRHNLVSDAAATPMLEKMRRHLQELLDRGIPCGGHGAKVIG